jgi:hypothetical protein
LTPAGFKVSAGAPERPDPCLSPTGRGRRRPRDLDPRPLPTWRTPYPTLIGIRWPASESRRTPPPRPAKRGEGWGEGRRQAGPLIPTFSPADRGEGVTALSVALRSMPMLPIVSSTAHRQPDHCSQVVSATRIPRQGLPFFGRSSGRIASPAERERPPTEGRRERVCLGRGDLDPRPLPTWRTPHPTLIGIRWPASGSRRIPPPRPAKRGEGWGEGRRQAGPLIPTFSPADRGEGVRALSVKPRSMPMLPILSPTAHGYPDLCSQVLSGTRAPTQGLPFFGRSSGRIASPAQRERPPTEGRRERVRAHGTPAPCLKPCLPSPGALRAPASPRCAPLRGARHVAAGSPAGAVTLTPGEAR